MNKSAAERHRNGGGTGGGFHYEDGHNFGDLVWDQGHSNSCHKSPPKNVLTAEESAAVFTENGTNDEGFELSTL